MSSTRRPKNKESLVCYELLRPRDVVKRRETLPLAYLPLGVLEWHGFHNPLGLDGLKVHGLCVEAASIGGGLVFPVVWYGENRASHLAEVNRPVRNAVRRAMKFHAGDFADPPESALSQTIFYQQLIWQIFHQIRGFGFKAIYVLVGHGPLKAPAQVTAQLFERVTGIRVAVSYAAELVSGYTEDHAGRFETGVMMALRPELVEIDALGPKPKSRLVGINGDEPRRGSAKLGKTFVPECVTSLARAGRDLVRRKPSDGAMSVK